MILKNCRLIPALSGGIQLSSASIRLKDGKIEQIAPALEEAQGEEVLDCGGRTLLPGFWDLHTHLTGLSDYPPSDVKIPMKLLIDAIDLAKDYLDYGFTTIRDCGSSLRAANYVRDLAERRLIESPRVIACGRIVGPTETGIDNPIAEMDAVADGPYEVRKAVRRELAEHADFIKIYASGSAFDPKGRPLQPIMTEDEVRAAVQIADMKGSYVAAHAHSDSAIRLCVESGVRTIEHSTYISPETIEILLRTPDCYLVPTLAAMYCNPGSDSPFWKARMGELLEAASANLRRAYLAGCKMGFGTDSIPGKGQYNHGIEFIYRRDYCGMSNIDILLQSTVCNAEIAGFGDCLGSVREGYIADLVLVSGNPDEDLGVLENKPDYVFQSGRLVRKNVKEDTCYANC